MPSQRSAAAQAFGCRPARGQGLTTSASNFMGAEAQSVLSVNKFANAPISSYLISPWIRFIIASFCQDQTVELSQSCRCVRQISNPGGVAVQRLCDDR
jgi:hypothetical protein